MRIVSERDDNEDSPRVRHMQDPISQHHPTEDGPPNKSGVLKVIARLEERHITEKAKLICYQVSTGFLHPKLCDIP